VTTSILLEAESWNVITQQTTNLVKWPSWESFKWSKIWLL